MLEPSTVAEPAVRCGRWLTRAAIGIADVSETAGAWWAEISRVAHEAFQKYQGLAPLERLGFAVSELEAF